jgi:hypothetical protein
MQVYYTTPAKKSEGVKGFWCHSCYSEHRGEVIELEGMRVRKVCGGVPCCCRCPCCWYTYFVLEGVRVRKVRRRSLPPMLPAAVYPTLAEALMLFA